jgi:hypothetical protein
MKEYSVTLIFDEWETLTDIIKTGLLNITEKSWKTHKQEYIKLIKKINQQFASFNE